MFCMHCGKELKEGSRFCNACGTPVSKTASKPGSAASTQPEAITLSKTARENANQVVSQSAPNRMSAHKKPAPIAIAAIAIVLLAIITCSVLIIAQQDHNGESASQADQVKSSAQAEPAEQEAQSEQAEPTEQATQEEQAEPVEPTESANSSALTSEPSEPEAPAEEPVVETAEIADPYGLNGWWHTLGQSGSVFHHIVGDTDYIYQRDYYDETLFTFEDSRDIVSVQHYETGEIPVATEPCNVVTFSNSQTYIQYDSSANFLDCQNPDGSGYSATSSIGRAHEIADQLTALAESVEGGSQATSQEAAYQGGQANAEQNAIDDAVARGMQILEGTVVATTYADRAHAVYPSLSDFDNNHDTFILLDLDQPATITSLTSGGPEPTRAKSIGSFCLNDGDVPSLLGLDGQHVVIAIDEDPYPTNRYWYSDINGALADAGGQFQLISPTA